ncbi:MAG: hypothetical protein PHX09_00605 [Clostridia bacterium]|nr:hypothetical protein [Clostridia bacterium]
MRFIKIFLASFFSLIGATGIILGIMYLAGSFNILYVEPQEIHFELDDYYVDRDFTITITSSTENVAKRKIELTLNNQLVEANGKISDGIIIVPKNVTLNVPFQVILETAYNNELGKYWIAGGNSVIRASSESDRAIDAVCEVNVDVPVSSINIVTYNNLDKTPADAFALGESFYAEAKFIPEESMYKYSTDVLKKVFFDHTINISGYVAENESIVDAMKEVGKTNIYGYDVLKISDNITINAYVFYSAKDEDIYINLGLSDDDLIRYVKNPQYGLEYSQSLVFTNRTVANFNISELGFPSTIKYKEVSYIYANNANPTVPNLGINIMSSDEMVLLNKISDVGLRLLVREGGVYREATDEEMFFTKDIVFEFAENINGEGLYFKDSNNEFILLSTVVQTRYNFNGTAYLPSLTGSYFKVNDEYILITGEYGTTYDKYYLPTVVPIDMENSYWTVVSLNENLDFYFEVRLFENGDVIEADSTILYTYDTANTWQSTGIVETDITWINETDKQLTFIDSAVTANKIYPEYNLIDNIEFSTKNATYTEVRFLAFSVNDVQNISEIIQNAQLTNKYNLSAYNIFYNLYEIDGNILKAFGDGSVCVVAVIIKTDFSGRPILDTDGYYNVYKISKPNGESINTYQELTINVDKTVQDINAEIRVLEPSVLKNSPSIGSGEINKLAFMQNQTNPVFKLDITVTAHNDADILEEIALFVEAWNTKRIYLQVNTESGVDASSILFYNHNEIIDIDSGVLHNNSWVLSIDFNTLKCNIDTSIYIKLNYEKTSNITSSKFITEANLPGELSGVAVVNLGQYLVLEVYDGFAYSANFAVNTSEEDVLEKDITISRGSQYGVNRYYATNISTAYFLNSMDVTGLILNSSGEYVVRFYDKYNNEITVSTDYYSLTKDGTNVVLTVNTYSSSLIESQKPTTTLYISEVEVGQILNYSYNQGKVEYGAFASDFKDATTEYSQNSNYLAKITRYGAGGSTINLLGSNGLLNIEYQASDGVIYQLYNVIDYNITTQNWQDTYNNFLSLSSDGNSINVQRSIGSEISLKITANAGLGTAFQIELTIKQNITVKPKIISSQTGASNYTYQSIIYEGIYSDNDVIIEIEFSMELYETVVLRYESDATNAFYFENEQTQPQSTYTIGNLLAGTVNLRVHYLYNELGMEDIKINTASGAYDYVRNIYLNVNANLELVDNTDKVIEKSIEIYDLNVDVPVLIEDDYQRILDTNPINQNGISIEIAEIISEQEDNIFIIQDFNIQAISKLSGSYLVKINVKYGNSTIGQIHLNVSANMKADTGHTDYANMFTNYNGKTHLLLLNLNTYEFEYLAELFENVSLIDFDPHNLENVYQINTTSTDKIIVSTLSEYTSVDCLVLTNIVGSVKYPVLFAPLDKGFLHYDESVAENSEATAIVNADMGYLLNENYLIENQIYDIYNSGTTTSLIRENYTLQTNNGVYSFKNLSEDSIYLLAFVTGASEGYYFHMLEGIGENDALYEFSLSNLVDTWTRVDNPLIVADEYLCTEPTFIGAFSASNDFSADTFVSQSKNGGISLNILNSSYSYRVIDENDDSTVDFSTTIVSPYAHYSDANGLFITESMTENKFVWLLISKNDKTILAYRILVIANSGLNIYYPHGNGIGISSDDNTTTDEAEYVTANNGSVIIDFNENISSSLPNSIAGLDIKRIMFQYGNSDIGWDNATNYTLIYSIQKISINEVITSDPQAIRAYVTLDSQNKLNIVKTNDILVVYVKVTVQVDGKHLNAEAYYKVVVNYSVINYALYYENVQGVPIEPFTETTATVDFGEIYDFSNIVLVNDMNTTLNKVEGLKYYVYSPNGLNLSEYVDLDNENKTLSILPGVEIVSDLQVRLLMYTMYGSLADINITFKSNIDFNYDTEQDLVDYNSETNQYEVYSDTAFTLNNIFKLTSDGIEIITNNADWQYSLDNGLTYQSGENISFSKVKDIITYQIKIKVLLTIVDNTKYKDDYFTTIYLKVKPAIISNYPTGSNPLNAGTIEYPTETGELEFTELLLIESTFVEPSYLFSCQNLLILENYTIDSQVITGNDYVIVNLENAISNRAFKLNCSSPADEIEIVIAFTLIQDEFEITSYFTFRLKPDLYLNTYYPNPNDETDYTSEANYLNGEYINDSISNNTFSTSKGSMGINLNGAGFFNTKRTVFTDGSGTVIESTALTDRVVVAVTDISNNIVASYKSGTTTYLNTDITLERGAKLTSNIYFQWVGTSTIVTNTTATVTFSIYIDGVHRGLYTIIFYSSINDIFTVNLSMHNQTMSYDGGITNAEVFFVENKNTGNLFSNQEALLSFTLRQSYTNSLKDTTDIWEAYVNSATSENLIGKIKVNATSTAISWALTSALEISLDNIIIVIGENEYVFNSDADNSIFTKYINPGIDYSLNYRADAYYLNQPLSYEKYELSITIDGTVATEYKLSKSNVNAIDNLGTVNIGAGGATLGNYYYTLIYDFKINELLDSEHHAKPISSGESIPDVLNAYEITQYNGNPYSREYFNTYENTIDFYVIMITDIEYESTQSTDNIKYLNSDYIEYYKPNYAEISLLPEYSTYIDYVNISYTQDLGTKNTYNFTINANGAENEGNYIYFLVSFRAKNVPAEMTYAVVKLFITPIWSGQFYNDTENQSANDVENPLEIFYDNQSNSISTIVLVDKDKLNNYINIYNSEGVNYAVKNVFSYVTESEIDGYLKLDELYSNSGYFWDYLRISNADNTAKYGDKNGYLKISDKYGFTMYYYIRLKAQSPDALKFAGNIINATNNDLYEGSTISIVDEEYNEGTLGPITTFYGIKITNLQYLIDNNFTYKITYLPSEISGSVLFETYNTNPLDPEYNTGKIKLQVSSFYGTASNLRQPITLQVKMEISNQDETYSETIVIPININVVKRYTVGSSTSSYIRDGVPFNVSDYIYVLDDIVKENIGEIELSNNQFTLVVPAYLKNTNISISASEEGNIVATSEIIVGKDSKGNVKLPTPYDEDNPNIGDYYYPLKELKAFKNIEDFSNYTFSVISVKGIPNETGIYWSPKTNYTFDNEGNLECTVSNTTYFLYNSFPADKALVYTDGNNHFWYKNFAYNILHTISTSGIISTWETPTGNFGSHSTAGFVGVYDYSGTPNLTTPYTGLVYDYDTIAMIADKLLSVVTINLQSDDVVTVVLNNSQYQALIPFVLNYDGVQNISVYEAILKEYGSLNPRINNITNYEKDSQVMSIEDQQKLKGVVIYNNTISLEIVENMAGINLNVRVYYDELDGTKFKAKTFPITNNSAHFYFVSIYDILGEKLGLYADNVSYKIEIEFTKTDIISGNQDLYKNNVTLADNFLNEVTYVYNQESGYCTYTITIDAFEIKVLERSEDGLYTDIIDIKNSNEFVSKIKSNVKKSYLVKYSKDFVIYPVSVNYNVTPQYYAVDESGNSAGDNYRIIYGESIEQNLEDGTYKVDFVNWSGGFNLLDYYNKKIKSLTSAEYDLLFEIQTIDGQGDGTSTGAAYLNADNSLQTTPSFNAEQHYIRVSIDTYVDENTDQKIHIGDINIKLDTSSLYVPVKGTYNVKINSPVINGTYFTINTPYLFGGNTAEINDIIRSDELKSIVNDNNELGFYTGSGFTYRKAKDCTFSVVSVISNIDEAVFENGNLSIKINLNKTQNSKDKKITLEAVAVPQIQGDMKTSIPFFLVVNFLNGVYCIEYSDDIIYEVDGYYNVIIDLKDIFPTDVFVGSDYSYVINIKEINNNSSDTGNLPIVYADNSLEDMVEIGETMFFLISYVDKGSLISHIIGLKYTEDTQILSGEMGYAINLKTLFGDMDLDNCTTSFLGSYPLACENGEENINLLLSYTNSNSETTYSIAFVEKYSDTDPFIMIDYEGSTMINCPTALSSSVTKYQYDVVEQALTYLKLSPNRGSSDDSYYAVENLETYDMDMYGIKPIYESGAYYVILDVSDYATSKKVTITNFNSVSDNVSSLFGVEDMVIQTYWQSDKSFSSLTFTGTTVEKQTSIHNSNTYTQYKFDIAPGYWLGNLGNISLTNGNVDVSSLTNAISEDSYYFSFQDQETFSFAYAVIKGSELQSVDISAIRDSFLIEQNGTIRISYLDISGNIDNIGLYKYAIIDWTDFMTKIKTTNFTSIAGTNYYITTDNILENNKYAEMVVNNTVNVSLQATESMTYFSIVNEDNSPSYYVIAGNQFTEIELNCENMEYGDIINIYKYASSLPITSFDNPLILIVPYSNYSQTFILKEQSQPDIEINVPARTTSYEIDLSEMFILPLNLVIIASY